MLSKSRYKNRNFTAQYQAFALLTRESHVPHSILSTPPISKVLGLADPIGPSSTVLRNPLTTAADIPLKLARLTPATKSVFVASRITNP